MIENKIKLICDSSVDLPKEFFEKENIEIIRFTISVGDKSYTDGLDITTEQLFKYIDENNALPKTAANGPLSYEEVFKKFTNDYDDVIFIGLGNGFSSSLNSARIAAQEFKNVHVLDSGNLSGGTGLIVLKIVKMIKEGLTAQEIIEKVNAMVPLVRCQFACDTLKYLYLGGRCKATAKYIATALHIKPIIAVRDGKMEVTKKPIGFKKALDIMLEQAFAYKDIMDLDHILVTHPAAENDAVYLKKRLAEVFDKDIIMETRAGGSVATHCGPRTIGILYILKEDPQKQTNENN